MDGRLGIRIGTALLVLALSACASGLRKDVVKEHSEALPPAPNSSIAQAVEPAKATRPPDQSGFRLLTLNTNALLSRVVLAEKAEHSIDLQTFVYENDDTGRLIAEALLKAADRGVRVRLLVDDMGKKNGALELFEALEAHDNIEVRVFNPFNSRDPGAISKAAQLLFEFRRLNRRMHNKSFIVDNKIAVIGGRNIGDDYFDANADNNFRDVDLLAIGPVVEQASRAFDTYWNDKATLPASAWKGAKDSPADLAKVRADISSHVRAFGDSDYAQVALQEMPDGPTADRQGQWFWGLAEMVADHPEKVSDDGSQPGLRIGPRVKGLMYGAASELLVITPYFVPGADDLAALVALAGRGVKVGIATNSLASTDSMAVHSEYGQVRKELLAGGVGLYEIKPHAGVKQTDAQRGDRGVTLHAKSFVVDGRTVFVGSMNMDQRSDLLNTEQGIVVDSPALAKAVTEFYTTVTQPANAWKLALKEGDKGGIIWTSEEGGQTKTVEHEPEVGPIKRGEVMLLRLLPLDGLL